MYRVVCDGSVVFQDERIIACENYIMKIFDKFPNHIDMTIQKQIPLTKWVTIT